jgi:hypothetical protein
MRDLVFFGAILCPLALAGCAGDTRGVTARAGGPDEYAVARAAPLVIPPDYNLVPPAPGAPRPQEADSSTQALQALFGGAAARSATERGVLTAAQATAAAPGIRTDVGAARPTTVDKGSTTRDILAAPVGNGPDATVSTPQ